MITILRNIIQTLSFAILTFGGRIGISLGFIPCFACPFVYSCGGSCYLFSIQRMGFLGLGLFSSPNITPENIFYAVKVTLIIIILILIFSKVWCGWICPFGTLQDWIAKLRKKMGISEYNFSWKTRARLRPIKYILLLITIIVPLLVMFDLAHNDLNMLFCKICPARLIMPFFAGDSRFWGINYQNGVVAVITILSIVFTAITIVGSFFKDRFFCMFCPMLPIIQLFKKFSFIQLEKNVDTCSGCSNCQRNCPMNIRSIHLEKEDKHVMDEDCLLCFRCLESCPEDEVLKVKFFGHTILTSSKIYAIKKYLKNHKK